MILRRAPYLLLILILSMMSPLVWSQATDFERGVELAEEQKFQEAIKVWEALPEGERHTYEWLVNMAMAEEELGDFIKAKAKWLYIQKEFGPDRLIQSRLEIINQHLSVQKSESTPFIGITFKGKVVPASYWLMILITLSLIALLITLLYRNKLEQSTIKKVLMMITFLFVLISIQWLWQDRQLKRLPEYVLNTSQDWNYEEETPIRWTKGLSLRLIEEKEGRVRVENALGERATIPKGDINRYDF